VLAEQRHQGRGTDNDQHEDQTLQARDLQIPRKPLMMVAMHMKLP
jgi:hypothetical protein